MFWFEKDRIWHKKYRQYQENMLCFVYLLFCVNVLLSCSLAVVVVVTGCWSNNGLIHRGLEGLLLSSLSLPVFVVVVFRCLLLLLLLPDRGKLWRIEGFLRCCCCPLTLSHCVVVVYLVKLMLLLQAAEVVTGYLTEGDYGGLKDSFDVAVVLSLSLPVLLLSTSSY